MKRFLSLMLLLAMVLSLCACAEENGVTFYYVRSELEYQYGTTDGVIVGENREAAGHVDDLRYLLILYLHGPVSDNLESPFPIGTDLVELTQEKDSLTIRLSSIASIMEGKELTLACACLAQTCFTLTDVQSVTILAVGRETVSMTMERGSLVLVDNTARTVSEATE